MPKKSLEVLVLRVASNVWLALLLQCVICACDDQSASDSRSTSEVGVETFIIFRPIYTSIVGLLNFALVNPDLMKHSDS